MNNKTNDSLTDMAEDRLEEFPFNSEKSNKDNSTNDKESDYDMAYDCCEPSTELIESYLLFDSLVRDTLSLEEENDHHWCSHRKPK